MSGRTVRVYRLDIIYPEGSREPGWRPPAWSNPVYLAQLPRKQRRALVKAEFKWPRERLFLASSAAVRRKWLLESYGADVEVLASAPVTWPDLEPRTEHWLESAQWFGGTLQREVAEFDPSGLPLAPEIPAEDDGLFGWVDEIAEFERAGREQSDALRAALAERSGELLRTPNHPAAEVGSALREQAEFYMACFRRANSDG